MLLSGIKSVDGIVCVLLGVHSNKPEAARVATMRIVHDRSFSDLQSSQLAAQPGLFEVTVNNTLPVLEKIASSSRESIRLLKPETWRLFPGLIPASPLIGG
jgi:hypothetical protein